MCKLQYELEKFMKALFVTAFLVLAFTATGTAQKCTEYTYPGRPFAVCVPDGFKAFQDKTSKDFVIEAPPSENRYISTITLRGEARTESRADVSLKLINGAFGFAGYKNTRIIRMSDMKLPSGLDATVLVFFVDIGDIPLAISYLLVDGPNKTNADFFVLYRRDEMASLVLINGVLESIHAK